MMRPRCTVSSIAGTLNLSNVFDDIPEREINRLIITSENSDINKDIESLMLVKRGLPSA
ncbi:hypothetical protein KDA08_04790 [Candidatus Saccharibacteria bacterium]|nr:hypothetical protein [Candidatus Saccharibacteria bacterium]